MDIGIIPGFTRELGKPRDWDNTTNGVCETLPVRDIESQGVPFMLSQWQPNEREREMIALGYPIVLWIQGIEQHPVVAISIDPTEIPEL